MTASPDSARPATRRALRERSRARTGADGDPGAGAETPTDANGADAATTVLAPENTAGVDRDDAPETAFLLAAPTTPPIAPAQAQDALPEPLPETEFLAGDATGAVPARAHAIDASGSEASAGANLASDESPVLPRAEWADEQRPPTALTWLDARTVAEASAAPAPQTSPARDILAGARRRPDWLRARVLAPVGIIAGVCGAYVGATLLWPLTAVAPQVTAVQVETAPAPAAAVTWPATGSAAVGVQGLSTVASTSSADEIASISKVASVMMVLDELPLEPGEQGPSFAFDDADARDYWQYRWSNQSALDVPAGGSLTEYQMLQGVMLGSANNYIDRLAEELWGGEDGFADAARTWLSDHGISGMTLMSPSGFDERNVATPEAVVALGELAMRNPVFAEIVGTRSAEIPGAGTVSNSNEMLGDTGVIGIKTGTLSHWNLLTAKEVPIGDTTVRVFTSVLGQDDNDARIAATRSLLSDVEKALTEQPVTVPAGTVVGRVTTEWGASADVVTDADTQVVLWNEAIATTAAEFSLGESTEKGAKVGTLTTQGPLDSDATAVSLSNDVPGPSIWWRLTHPLELFGLDKD